MPRWFSFTVILLLTVVDLLRRNICRFEAIHLAIDCPVVFIQQHSARFARLPLDFDQERTRQI